MSRARLLCGLWVSVSLWTPQLAFAQERTGSISGTVTDSGHYVLPGARIELEPKGLTVVSDQQGRFTIQNVPGGNYMLAVSYVGLRSYTEQLTVAAGQNTSVEAVLQVAVKTRPPCKLPWFQSIPGQLITASSTVASGSSEYHRRRARARRSGERSQSACRR